MAGLQVLYPALLLSLAYWRSTALLSDFKTCGDPVCERPLSRVRAAQDYKGPDCRFLSFQRGQVIFVYYKLSGKRDDLWAGSIDTQFGYFPKDAVEVDEVYIQKEKQIEIPAQEQDFFCIDEYGAIIEGDFGEWKDQGENEGIQKTPADDSQHPGTSESVQEQQSSFQSTEDTDKQEESQPVMPDPLDNTKSQTEEQGGSNWIGSGLTGLLGFDGRSVSDSKDKKTEEQDSFRSRKLSLDVEVNQLEKEVKTERAFWFGERLTGVFGFGKKSQDVTSKTTPETDKLTKQNKEQATSGSLDTGGAQLDKEEASAAGSWLNTVIGEVLSFKQTNDSQHQDTDQAEKGHTITEKPSSSDSSQTNDGKDRGTETHLVENTLTENKEHNTDSDKKDTKVKNDAENGWYGSIVGLYDGKQNPENYANLQGNFQEGHSQNSGSGQKDKVAQDESENNVQSFLSVGDISTMFDSLTSKIQPDVPDGNSDSHGYDKPAVKLTVKGKEVSTQHQTSIVGMPAEDSERENTDQSKSINEPGPSISTQESTCMHNEIQSVAGQVFAVEDLPSVNDNLKSELESLQPQSSDISEELSSYTEPNTPQPEELAKKQSGGTANTDGGKSEHLSNVLQEQIKEKYNTDIYDNLSKQDNVNSFTSTLDLESTKNTNQPVVAEKILDEELHRVDVVKEEEKSVGLETHYYSSEDAQYPRADYSEQKSSVDSRKTLSPIDNGSKSVVTDSDDKSSVFDGNESSVSDRGEPSSLTDTEGGPHVTDSKKDLSFTDCGKKSSMTDSKDGSTMTKTGDRCSVEGSLIATSVEKLTVMDGGQESSVIYNGDKSTVNEKREELPVFEKEEESSVMNSKKELTVTGIEEGSSVIENDKQSAETEHEEGSSVAKGNEGSVDADGDDTDVTVTAKVSVEEVVTETPEIKKTNVQGPHVIFSATEEESEINSSLISDEKEYKANMRGKDRNEDIKTANADTGFSEEVLHQVEDLPEITDSTEGDVKKSSYQFSFPQQVDTRQEGIESKRTRIWNNTITDKEASVLDDKKGMEGQDLSQSSTKMIPEQSDNRTPHVTKIDSQSILPQTKLDHIPETTEGGTYTKTSAETPEAEAKIHQEGHFISSVGNSELEESQTVLPEDFSEVTEFQNGISTIDERMAITSDSLSTYSQDANEKEIFAGDADAEHGYSNTGEEQKTGKVPKNTPDVSQSETSAQITDETLMEETNYVKGSCSECEQLSSSNKHPETHRIPRSDDTHTMEEEKSSEEQLELQRAEGQAVSEATHEHGFEEQLLHQKSNGNYSNDKVISHADGDFISSSHSKSYEILTAETDKDNVAHSEEVFSEGFINTIRSDAISEELVTKNPNEGITETTPQNNHIETARGFHVSEAPSDRIPDALKSKNTLKEYKNVQKHMSEEDLLHVLEVLGKHKLLWLDYHLGNPEGEEMVESLYDDLPILSDLEQMLQYHIEMTSNSKGSQDGDAKAQNENVSLQKLKTLLSTLKSRFSAEKSAVSINSNQADTDRPGHSPAFIPSGEKDSEAHEGEMADRLNKHSRDGELASTNQRDTGFHQSTMTNYKTEITEIITLCMTFAGQVVLQGKDYVQSSFLILKQVVSSLPSDMTPGPDLCGLPWEAVIPTVLVGMITLLLFTCRSYQSVRVSVFPCAGKEKKMGQKVAELLEEKCKVLETLSQCQHKYDELEAALQNGGISAHASEREELEAMSRKLEESNAQLNNEVEQLKQDLKSQRSMRSQQEGMLASMQETLKNLEEESKDLKSKIEQAQITVKIHNINSEKLQTNLQVAKEENAQLLESKAQLVQEAEGWAERLSELEEEMKMCESSHKAMVEDCSNKDQHIKSLTDCLLKMRDWDSEEEDQTVGEECEEASAGAGDNTDGPDVHQKQKVQKLIYAAKMSADLKSVEEEKNRLFARLADEIKAKEDLREGIERLQNEKDSLQTESATYATETQKLQQKLQIMTEMYQENELKLHSMLTVEERERLQKEEKLNKADKKISQAAEELSTYRQRALELEEELEKTNQAYRNQIAAHEKKAHDNWLAARAADRDLADVKRENALLRQKLTDSQFKLEMVEKDPFIGRPPFRGERAPFGHSPLGRPSSETRAFLSPPTLMDGPLRLSPQFPLGPGGRASRGPLSLADHPVASEGEGRGPHSDSGSVSPIWEKDRRDPVPPPGFPYPDPGFHYRRPPPGAVPLGPLPPRGPGPAEAHVFSTHPTERSADVSLLSSHSDGLGLSESRDSLLSASGEPRIPPEADVRKGLGTGVLPMGPPLPLDPRDQVPRRAVCIPPEFFPPRGPPMGMHGPPPPGMFPRFPPHLPQHMGYPPPRPPPNSLSGPPRRPSPPGSEQPPEQTPSSQEI
ncbi:melanoma inhibitory activity protein 3 isoform X1 [Arapaima gigas]